MSAIEPLCHVCGGSGNLKYTARDLNRSVTQERFRYYDCGQCGSLFLYPLPVDLGRYYPSDYHYVPESAEFLRSVAHTEAHKLELVTRFREGGKLLEIGPSTGAFVYAAKLAGFDTSAIEIDERCAAFLNDIAGIPTVASGDTVAVLPDCPSFDVITLWHVVEHLTNPVETLVACAEKLNPGGLLVVAAPNPESLQFKIMGARWPHLDAPRHTAIIPRQFITRVLKERGFDVLLDTTSDTAALGWNAFGWEYFFKAFAASSDEAGELHRVARRLTDELKAAETLPGAGSAYSIVFRKASTTDEQS
jgi:2-polyprenyl-3-methyl-5-hydroxy-6-metoxy-1,4-benzoquinol methylase